MSSIKRWIITGVSFGVGLAIGLSLIAGGFVWYEGRPKPPKPWNTKAITAQYAELRVKTSEPLIMEFHFVIENHTDLDYNLPNGNSVYKVKPNQKGLEQALTAEWVGDGFIPARQKMNIALRLKFNYTASFPKSDIDNPEKLGAFVNPKLAEMDGFVVLDQVTRYQINLPKEPIPKEKK